MLQGKSALLVEDCLLLINITQYGTIVQSITMESRFLESSVFWKFPIIRTKLNLPLPVRHCNFTPDFSNFPIIRTKLIFPGWLIPKTTVPYISTAQFNMHVFFFTLKISFNQLLCHFHEFKNVFIMAIIMMTQLNHTFLFPPGYRMRNE